MQTQSRHCLAISRPPPQKLEYALAWYVPSVHRNPAPIDRSLNPLPPQLTSCLLLSTSGNLLEFLLAELM